MGHALGNNYGKFYSFQSKPVILDLQFQVNKADTSGTGITLGSLKGQGVSSVFMQSSVTPAAANPFVNSTSAGYAQINLAYNYARAYCLDYRISSPVTGSALAINGSALTIGLPYQIITVGAGASGTATIAPVADVSGSLASTWFSLFDSYGNTFIIWFNVSGVGSAPNLGVQAPFGTQGLHYVQQSIATNATAATIGAALVTTIAALPSGISGVSSFTASGSTTVTVTSTAARPIAGPPADGVIATGFTFAIGNFQTNDNDWRQVGLPPGVQAAVGAGFIATKTGFSTGGGSSGTVKALTNSGIITMEVLADMNLSISPQPVGPSAHVGGQMLIQFLGATSSSVTTLIPTAPADTSLVKMKILLEQAARVGGNQE